MKYNNFCYPQAWRKPEEGISLTGPSVNLSPNFNCKVWHFTVFFWDFFPFFPSFLLLFYSEQISDVVMFPRKETLRRIHTISKIKQPEKPQTLEGWILGGPALKNQVFSTHLWFQIAARTKSQDDSGFYFQCILWLLEMILSSLCNKNLDAKSIQLFCACVCCCLVNAEGEKCFTLEFLNM